MIAPRPNDSPPRCRWLRLMVLAVALVELAASPAAAQQAGASDAAPADGLLRQELAMPGGVGGPRAAPATRRRARSSGPRAPRAAGTRAPNTQRRARQSSRQVTVPVEIAVGPTFLAFGNPKTDPLGMEGVLYEDQRWHYGLRLNISAIIDKEFVDQNPQLVPKKYRGHFKQGTEFRFTPGVLSLIPRDFIFSPGENTEIFGATWQLAHLGTGVDLGPLFIGVGAGLVTTLAYIDTELVDDSTVFVRPGADVMAHARLMLGESFGISGGWDSNFYLPQKIGGGIFDAGEGDTSLWHIGQAFVLVHFRFPYTTTL